MSLPVRYLAVVLAFVASLAAIPGNATVVSGTFVGIARDTLLFTGGTAVPTFGGAAISGTFRVDTALIGSPSPQSPDFVSYVLSGAALELSFTTDTNTYTFGSQGLDSAATVFNNGVGQSVTLAANVLGQTEYAALFSLGAISRRVQTACSPMALISRPFILPPRRSLRHGRVPTLFRRWRYPGIVDRSL